MREGTWRDLRIALVWIRDGTGRLALEVSRRSMFDRSTPLKTGIVAISPKFARAERKAWVKLRTKVANGEMLLRGEPYAPSVAKQRVFNSETTIYPELALTLELDNENGNCELRPQDWQKDDQQWWRNVSVNFLSQNTESARRRQTADGAASKKKRIPPAEKDSLAQGTSLASGGRTNISPARSVVRPPTGKALEAYNLICEIFGEQGPSEKIGAAKIRQRIYKAGNASQKAIAQSMHDSTVKRALEYLRPKPNPK